MTTTPISQALITVSGNIGAGKSTFSALLADQLGMAVEEEAFADNPYLERFYQDPVRWGFLTQQYFIADAISQQQRLGQTRAVVQDRTVYERAEVFVAAMHQLGQLSDEQAAELMHDYQQAIATIAGPDLHIHLAVRPEVAQARIAGRGRGMEAGIPLDYLTTLDQWYQHLAANWQHSPLLVVDVSNCDVRVPEVLERITEDVRIRFDDQHSQLAANIR